jgi:Trk K+ transport system NAD-binding subunit
LPQRSGGRVLVFDLGTLQFKRGWGAYGKKLADISADPADHQWVGNTPPKDFQSHLTVAISRDGFVYAPDGEQPVEIGDELLFVAAPEAEPELEELLNPGR